MEYLKCPRCSIPLHENGTAAQRYADVEHVVRCAAQNDKLSIQVIGSCIAALGILAEKVKHE